MQADSFQTVCAIMFLSSMVFIGLSYTKSRPHRVFHYITAAITMVAAIAYFTMGADLGQTGIKPEFIRSNPKVSGNLREIFYVRYIDWYVDYMEIERDSVVIWRQGCHDATALVGLASDRWAAMAHYPLYTVD